MNDAYKTVAVYSFMHDLDLQRSFLEANGIRCYVKDEFSTIVQPNLANITGGIHLQVHVNDFVLAKQLLASARTEEVEDLTTLALSLSTEEPELTTVQQEGKSYNNTLRLYALLLLIVIIVGLLYYHYYLDY